MSSAEIFRTYLQRFTSGDTAGAAELLTDDFRFHGPMLQSQGKAAFLEGSAPLGPIMRGAEIHRQWEDGGELCSFYDFKIETPAGAGSVSYTHLRAHETRHDLVCRLLLEKKK